ncbi:MAG: hypothetical protein ACLQIK_12230 [Mycobacterium sp.]|uniref:hypothetical protein n=1 Tax=Mycobacterium sp. TaxID=1785 RepID=UPI003F94AB88
MLNPKGDVVATEDIESADKAPAWFADDQVEGNELGWRMEVEQDGEWHFFDDSEGDRSY